MNEPNDDLDLQSLWQDTPPIDVDELIKSVNTSRQRMHQVLAIELIGSLGALALVFIYQVWGVFGDVLWPAGLMCLFVVGYQYWTWRWRHGLWQSVSDSPMDMLKLQKRRAKLSLRIAHYYLYGTPIFCGLGLGFALLAIDDNFTTGISGGFRLALIISAFGLMALTMIYGWQTARRSRQEIVDLDAKIAELENIE